MNFLVDNPQYKPAAAKIVGAVGNIIKAVKEHGSGTIMVMAIAAEAVKLTQVTAEFLALPKDQRDEFFGEVFDMAIGEEEEALVKKVAFFEGKSLEMMSDGMKAAFVAFMNRQIDAGEIA